MKLLLIFLLSILMLSDLTGQNKLQGIVNDETGAGLYGAHISISSLDKGTVSDQDGKFVLLNIPQGKHLLSVSFVGYQSKEIPVTVIQNAQNKIEISLSESDVHLSELVITASTVRALSTLSQSDIKLRPIASSQDILRIVPGLFIGQHAGGGKAEQIFLRGFDIDHGTDISIDVDGVPVNMVSHAHGQGYADLHFVIPELIQTADFNKGPYYADKGDLNTAGYVSFQTKSKLERNFIKTEGGQFGMGRLVTGINFSNKNHSTGGYVAGEVLRTDGFFQSSQHFKRLNLQARFHAPLTQRSNLQAGLTIFHSLWNASGQIPLREVNNHRISRFGSIDNTEGGTTGRVNLFFKIFQDLKNGSSLDHQVFGSSYDFDLFSNFTFFLKDSVNGDQIQQKENRWIYGYKNHYTRSDLLFGKELRTEAGVGFRGDEIMNIGLANTVKRIFIEDIKKGDIHQVNANAFVSLSWNVSPRFSVNPGVRLDHFYFSYFDKKENEKLPAVSKSIVNPKLNLNYKINPNINFYLQTGTGFHSNDARVVVLQSGYATLPRAYGIDFGGEMKISQSLFIRPALWLLNLEQEFLYVGDEGVIEPGGKTRRYGFDFSARYQFGKWLFADVDWNMTRARSRETGVTSYIPLAPVLTSSGGIGIQKTNGFQCSLRYRYMGDRPANETNSITAGGYFITDVVANYNRPGYSVGLSIENIFNKEWRETQFETTSRLKKETAPVTEIHFTPGTPLAAKIKFTKYL